MEEEHWKDVVGYEGYYMVSNLGKVRSVDKTVLSSNKVNGKYEAHKKGKIFSNCLSNKQYYRVTFSINNKRVSKAIHVLVAEAFIPNTQHLPQVNHKDGNKLNNRVENLEWCTASQNTQHAYDSGLMNTRHGEQNYNSILKDEDIPHIRQLNKEGVSHGNIAKLFKCSKSTIKNVIHKRSWKHI